jgi:hypothetical protein
VCLLSSSSSLCIPLKVSLIFLRASPTKSSLLGLSLSSFFLSVFSFPACHLLELE